MSPVLVLMDVPAYEVSSRTLSARMCVVLDFVVRDFCSAKLVSKNSG